ncbi:MAG: hypothetical protein JWP74_4045 [Marmoricola sp.]|nr:hypothetical protein [Marmoricola sp.]
MKTRLGTTASVVVLAFTALVAVAVPAQGTAQRTPWCGNADLKAGYRHSDDGAGHSFGWIVLRNRSDHTCRTGGFGGISYVGDGNGTRIGAPADHTGTPSTYVLRPGQRLRSALQETRAADYERAHCRPHHVDGFRVYVPDSRASQFVAHATTGCLNPGVHLLTHQAYRRP